MGKDSKIEWCDHTVNLWWGCSKVHTGCKNCYAEELSETRYKTGVWGEKKPRKLIKSAFKDLDKYERHARENGFKEVVFVGSMMDIFEESKPLITGDGKMVTKDGDASVNYMEVQAETGDVRAELFTRISEGEYDNLIFLFLTKRPENIEKFVPIDWVRREAPENVYFGTSISDQETADNMVHKLLLTSVIGNYFLSVEPQIGEIDLSGFIIPREAMATGVLKQPIKWVIQGGESGRKKRPFKVSWAYMIKAQCKEGGIPYFFKQIDKVQPIPEPLKIQEFPFIKF